MFRRKRSVNKKKLEYKLYLARETPEPIFDLSECDLIDVPTGIYSLCKVFLKTSIVLRKNQLVSLSGGGDLRDLHLLKILDISYNNFNSLPDEIGVLVNLEELYANNNCLKKLPQSLSNLVNLQILFLSNNLLKILPENIGDLSNLTLLNICDNKHLRYLPKSIHKAQKLVDLVMDSDNFSYPPADVCRSGTENIVRFICEDANVEYVSAKDVSETRTENNTREISDETDFYQDKLWELGRLKQQKIQEFLEIEKNNELLQRQEFEMANAQKENRKKLLADISRQQSKLDLELSKIQQLKELDRFKLIEQLQQVENNADIAINKLLNLSREPQNDLIEMEKLEEAKLVAAVHKYNESLQKDDILSDMEDILLQETERFLEFDRCRTEAFKSVLEQELETHEQLSAILQDHSLQKAELVSKILIHNDLQKAAVGTLLERGDARCWSLLQQVRLVEAQLAALTNIELDRRKLSMNKHLNDMTEKRINLSMLLMDLLDQQSQRRAQLLSTLNVLEESSDNSEDFWLKQYQRLLEKLPEGLSQAQKNIDPGLAQALLLNGVWHCLPFLANLAQCGCDITSSSEEILIEAGISNPEDRTRVMDAFQVYSKRMSCATVRPSAPPQILLDEASAPPIEEGQDADEQNVFNTVECVICLELECQTIFVPCGHFCCCKKCSGYVTSCPLCRSDIQRKIAMLR